MTAPQRRPMAAPATASTPIRQIPAHAMHSHLSLEEMDIDAQLAWLDGADFAESMQPQTVQAEPQVTPKPQPPIAQIPVAPNPAPTKMRAVQSVQPSQPVKPAAKPASAPMAAPLTAAQGFYGFARGSEAANRQTLGQPNPQDTLTIARIQSLQSQLQEIVTQIESLQANLPSTESTIQVVEEVPATQSGLVQQAFHVEVSRSEISRNDVAVQHIHRVAS